MLASFSYLILLISLELVFPNFTQLCQSNCTTLNVLIYYT